MVAKLIATTGKITTLYWPATPWAYWRPVHKCNIKMLSACTRFSDWPIRNALRAWSCGLSFDFLGVESVDFVPFESFFELSDILIESAMDMVRLAWAVVSLSRASRSLDNCTRKTRERVGKISQGCEKRERTREREKCKFIPNYWLWIRVRWVRRRWTGFGWCPWPKSSSLRANWNRSAVRSAQQSVPSWSHRCC